MYNWESGGNHIRRKKVNKTGTVVFHKDPAVDTAFDRLAKEVPLGRIQRNNTNRLQQDTSAAMDEENAMQFVTNKDVTRQTAPLMTPETIKVLTSEKGPFKFEGLLPSQAQCYKGIFKGRDVILHSRTGSGKTLAYALPLIERFLILDSNALKGNTTDKKRKGLPAPFLLIFVFSNELAFQTKTVLDNIYAKRGLKIAIAGMDTLSSFDSIDVLIGTVPAVDAAVRGKDAPLNPIRKKPFGLGSKRARDTKDEASKEGKKEVPPTSVEDMAAVGSDEDDSDLDSELNAETSSDEEDSNEKTAGYAPPPTAQVSASRVRCIVVDEVDTTLGPRFSVMGKRMKMLLHTVRRANGSLQPSRLMKDFRAHHYILCGATIPNWVIKAGFLGIKKYYFQLVEVGHTKLPTSLECYLMLNDGSLNPAKYSAASTGSNPAFVGIDVPSQTICESIGLNTDGWGRIVVFGTTRQIDRLEEAMNALLAMSRAKGVDFGSSVASSPKAANKNNKKSTSTTSDESALAAPSSSLSPSLEGWKHITGVRSISGSKDEVERIKNIADYNSGVANVLLCTDVASRGLDFVGVDVVFMLNLPAHRVMAAETFVHRAGRTARINNKGKCIALVDSNKDDQLIKGIETATHVVFRKISLSMLTNSAATGGDSAYKVATSNATSKADLAPTASAAAEEKTVKRVLVVKSPFVSATPGSTISSANPVQVLIRELKGKFDNDVRGGQLDLFEGLVKKLNVVDANAVTFETPLVYDHVLTAKLWKYNLKVASK